VDRDLPATLLTCPNGAPPLGGHVFLRWSLLGIVYEVASNGDIPSNRRLLEGIASNMQIIGSTQGSGGPNCRFPGTLGSRCLPHPAQRR
jgi:hypothetical protein